MFDKRLMQMCPESRKYIILQFLELCLNAVMIVTIAVSVQKLYEKVWTLSDLLLPFIIIACTIFARFFTTKNAARRAFYAHNLYRFSAAMRCCVG